MNDKGWKRVSECSLCGSPRCVVSQMNQRMAYCFRFGKTFFLSNDRRHDIGIKGKQEDKVSSSKSQKGFDFTGIDSFLKDF